MQVILQSFRDTAADAQRFISAAHVKDQLGTHLWPDVDRALAVEAGFLKVFIGWESFQEKAFHHLLLGFPTGSGRMVARYAHPKDGKHASDLLIGTARYVDWSTPETVRKLARLYLHGGDPFEHVLPSLQSDLLDLKTIRNAAAHMSTTTSAQLDALASRLLGSQTSNISVADLLLAPKPGPAGQTIFSMYLSVLDAAAYQIAMS